MEEKYLIVQAIDRRKSELASLACKANCEINAALDDYVKLLKNDEELLALESAIND